jgi:16S rRNA (guanine527-N7)-methyltransferase
VALFADYAPLRTPESRPFEGGAAGVTLAIVAAGAAAFGLELAPDALGKMERFVALLLAANQRLNLTRIVEPDDIERRHLLDSLTCALPVLETLQAGAAWRCLDVGSGGGLPGIPLAIAFPALSVTLLEATGKKTAFLRETLDALDLPNVAVVTARAEDAGRDPAHRDAYDLVVARALAPLDVALEWCLPFVKTGGVLVLPRGSDLAEQMPAGWVAAKALAARLRPPVPLDLADLPPGRALAVADKLGRTPRAFPRRAGLASKRPLGGTRPARPSGSAETTADAPPVASDPPPRATPAPPPTSASQPPGA